MVALGSAEREGRYVGSERYDNTVSPQYNTLNGVQVLTGITLIICMHSHSTFNCHLKSGVHVVADFCLCEPWVPAGTPASWLLVIVSIASSVSTPYLRVSSTSSPRNVGRVYQRCLHLHLNAHCAFSSRAKLWLKEQGVPPPLLLSMQNTLDILTPIDLHRHRHGWCSSPHLPSGLSYCHPTPIASTLLADPTFIYSRSI